jgi:putative transposase
LVDALDSARRRHSLELWAYVVMPEHVHVLFWPRDPTYRIRSILQSIKQPVARTAVSVFRESDPGLLAKLVVPPRPGEEIARPCHTTRHRFWQPGGGYDRNVTSCGTASKMVDYIHCNPVRRGLVGHPTDWLWSSARWYAGLEDIVLSMDASPPPP